MSPVVFRKTTASNAARPASVNTAASSVAVTRKPWSAPSFARAAAATGMLSWRKPAVLLKTRMATVAMGPACTQAFIIDPAARWNPGDDHAPTRHALHRPMGRPDPRHDGREGRAVRLRRAGAGLLGRSLRRAPRRRGARVLRRAPRDPRPPRPAHVGDLQSPR